mgnify:CR=1 FL=1
MSENILVPVLGESITEATVSKWLKNEGDAVEADEPIVELETDKVNLEVPSPVSGVLTKINSIDGSIVEVGALLGSVSGEASKKSKIEEIQKIEPKIQENNVVKFETQNQKISSRFNFKKSKAAEEIEFLNIFNNPLISFEIKKDEIVVKKSKKNINSEAIQEVLNREVFKKIILNFSSILTGKIKNVMQYKKYENGLYKLIRNENYTVFYKMYNDKFLPVIMSVDFFSISFDLKIIDWDIAE